MKILVGSVMKSDIMKDAILAISEPVFTFEGKRGMNMVFSCVDGDEKAVVRLVKDTLKEMEELGGLFYNVSADV